MALSKPDFGGALEGRPCGPIVDHPYAGSFSCYNCGSGGVGQAFALTLSLGYLYPGSYICSACFDKFGLTFGEMEQICRQHIAATSGKPVDWDFGDLQIWVHRSSGDPTVGQPTAYKVVGLDGPLEDRLYVYAKFGRSYKFFSVTKYRTIESNNAVMDQLVAIVKKNPFLE